MSLRLYLLRHGEPADTRMFYGHLDVGLSERGRAQVIAQTRALQSVRLDAIYSSDLSRAAFGAQAIAAQHGLEVAADPSLREMHLGALEGVRYEDAASRFPQLAGRSYADMLDFRMPDGGESVRDVAERVLPFVDAMIDRHRPLKSEHTCIVVYAHNTVCRVLLAQACGAGPAGYHRFRQRFGALNRIDFDDVGEGRDSWSGAAIAFCNVDAV